jgi:hypothetical protein
MIRVAIPAKAIPHALPRLLSDSAMLDISLPPKKGTQGKASLAPDLCGPALVANSIAHT